jgi:hypothetical protein
MEISADGSQLRTVTKGQREASITMRIRARIRRRADGVFSAKDQGFPCGGGFR